MYKTEKKLQDKLYEVISRKDKNKEIIRKLRIKHKEEYYAVDEANKANDTDFIYDLEFDNLIKSLNDVKYERLKLLNNLGKSNTETIQAFKKDTIGYHKSWIEGWIPLYGTRKVFFESPLYKWLTNNETLEEFLNTFEIRKFQKLL